jgi:hypothetical protein
MALMIHPALKGSNVSIPMGYGNNIAKEAGMMSHLFTVIHF